MATETTKNCETCLYYIVGLSGLDCFHPLRDCGWTVPTLQCDSWVTEVLPLVEIISKVRVCLERDDNDVQRAKSEEIRELSLQYRNIERVEDFEYKWDAMLLSCDTGNKLPQDDIDDMCNTLALGLSNGKYDLLSTNTSKVVELLFANDDTWWKKDVFPKLNQSFNHMCFVVALWLLKNGKPVTQHNIHVKLKELGVVFNNSSLSMRIQAHHWPTFSGDMKFAEAYDYVRARRVEPRTLVPEHANSHLNKLADKWYDATQENRILKLQLALTRYMHGECMNVKVDKALKTIASDVQLWELQEMLHAIESTGDKKVFAKDMKVFIDWLGTYNQYKTNWARLYHALDKANGCMFPRLQGKCPVYASSKTEPLYVKDVNHEWIGSKTVHAITVQVERMAKLLQWYPRSKTASKQAEAVYNSYLKAETIVTGSEDTTELCEDMQYACMLIDDDKIDDKLAQRLYAYVQQPKCTIEK